MDVAIGAWIAIVALVAMIADMPGPEYSGPADTCEHGGKFCPDAAAAAKRMEECKIV